MRGSFFKDNEDRGGGLGKANSSESITSIKVGRRGRLRLKDERSGLYEGFNSFIYISTILRLYKYKFVFFYTLIIYSFLILISRI